MKFKPKLSALLVALAMTSVTLAGCNQTSNNGSSSADSGSTSAQTEKFVVNIAANEEYTISGLDSEGYVEGATVNFAVTLAHPEDKAINQVTAAAGTTAVAVTAGENGYSFTMPAHDVNVTIALKNIDKYVLSYTGTANADETITLDLKLGNAPVAADFTIEGKTDADKAKIAVDGDKVMLKEAGEVTVVAKIGGEVKAELTITVGQSAIMSIQSALDAAIVEAPCNGSTGKNANMSSPKTIAGKVLALASYNNGAVQAIIDDGTAAVVVQLAKGENDPDPVEIGDAIRVTTVFTNYFGLLEGISKGAVSGSSGNANNIPKTDIIKINKEFTPSLAAAEDITAAQYETYYTACAANGQSSGENRTWTAIKYVNINVTFDKVDTDGSILYNIDGSEKAIDVKASHDEGESLDQVAGHKSKLTGFLLGVNSKKVKSNMIVMSQAALAVESITFKDGEEATIFLNNPVELEFTTAPEGSYGDATWESSEPTKVSVENGVVTGLEQGSSTITVTINGVSKSINVVVSGEQHVCESAELNKDSLSMVRGTEETLVATIAPNNCTDRVVWSSSNSAIASVDQEGKVSAVANGTATITVTCGNFSDACEVTVRDQRLSDLAHAKDGDKVDTYGYYMGNYPVSGKYGFWIGDGANAIYLNHAPKEGFAKDAIIHIVGAISAFNGGKQVAATTYEVVSSYEGLTAPATLNLDEAAITAIDETYQGRFATVTGIVSSHSGSGDSAHHNLVVKVGAKSIKVYVHKDNCGKTVTGSFDAAAVGKQVTITGYVTAYKSKVTDFTAVTADDYQLINPTLVDVQDVQATGLKMSKATADVAQGATLQLTAAADPEGATLPAAISWSVLDNEKVTVSDAGLVTVAADAVVDSTATVKATSGSLEATCVITVVSPAAAISSLAKYSITSEKGDEITDVAVIKGWFTKVSGDDIITSVSNPSKVYGGANGGSGATSWSSGNLLKIGTSSATGTLTINVSQDVSKIVIKGYSWPNKTCNLTVNTVVTSNALKDNKANKDNVAAGSVGTVEVEFTASKTITISASTSICITEIEFLG